METLGLGNTVTLILLLVCLAFSAFFSSSETAFISLPKLRVKHLVSTGVADAERVARIVEHPERLLAAILIGNNFVNTAAAVLGTVLAASFLGGKSAVLVATLGVTLLVLIFGEITPKTLTLRHAERLAFIYVRPMEIITWVLSPITALVARVSGLFGSLTGAAQVPKSLVSEEEIRSIISVGVEEGAVEQSEADMLHKVFQFGDRHVREIMVTRTDIIWVEEGTRLSEFLALYADHPYSRFPVYREMVDNIIGVLAVKDVLMAQAKGELDDNFDVTSLARPAFFVPESKHLGALLAEMQSSGNQMANVVDEFGGTAGIITMEQLVQEIVGDFGDELTRGERDFETIDERTFSVDGGMRIDEANEKLEIELPKGDYETVAGLVLSVLGHIPREGEQVKLKGLKLVVAEVKGVKIEKVVITKG